MPFFLKFSVVVLLLSFGAGQLWLNDAASPSAIASARSAVASCPVVGQDQSRISTQRDVIRALDAVWAVKLTHKAGLGNGCTKG